MMLTGEGVSKGEGLVVFSFFRSTVLYLDTTVLLEALPNSVNPKDPISAIIVPEPCISGLSNI